VEEEYGAGEWVKSHRETIGRLTQLKDILCDPSVPDGSVIRLTKSGQYSIVEQAIKDHEALTGKSLAAFPVPKEVIRA
jgi:hypothetical protein